MASKVGAQLGGQEWCGPLQVAPEGGSLRQGAGGMRSWAEETAIPGGQQRLSWAFLFLIVGHIRPAWRS
eukprot:10311751-Prorocentrum_lima.AAC.1